MFYELTEAFSSDTRSVLAGEEPYRSTLLNATSTATTKTTSSVQNAEANGMERRRIPKLPQYVLSKADCHTIHQQLYEIAVHLRQQGVKAPEIRMAITATAKLVLEATTVLRAKHGMDNQEIERLIAQILSVTV